VVNFDPFNTQESIVHVPLESLNIDPEQSFVVEDLLTGERYQWRGERNFVRLDPKERVGHVLRIVR
jgi:starch synthase (maltosyl-transferring)